MRSWLSEMASSVPSRPSYFLVTVFRSMYRPSASSPMATETPPAPKSLQRLIMRQCPRRCGTGAAACARSGALPFCTSAPQCSRDVQRCAPWRNRWHRRCRRGRCGRPAGRRRRRERGVSRRTWSAGRCAHNRADLHALGHIAGVVDLVHLTGGQADLVAVGGIAGGSGGHQLALGQLAGQRLGRRARVGSPAPVTRMA